MLIKGPFTAIGYRGDTWVHALPNPGLATGGTGDVLTGIIGGLLARGLPPDKAARLGVWTHGRVGTLVTSYQHAGGAMASDLIYPIRFQLSDSLEERPRVDPVELE